MARKSTRMFRVVAMVLLSIVLLLGQSSLTNATSLTVKQWQQQILKTETPGHGCFKASYPSLVWIPAACGSNSTIMPTTVGNGNDKGAAISGGYFSRANGQVTSMSGYQYESDSKFGQNYFSIQLNSNTYPMTFDGHPANGWTQFMFLNNWDSGAGTGYIEIEWWLLNYQSGGTCPSGWKTFSSSGGEANCYTGYLGFTNAYDPSLLPAMVLDGLATGSQDQTTFCFGGACNAVSAADTVFLSQSHWTNIEWNVFGLCCYSQANFNSGLSLTIGVTGGMPDRASLSCNYQGYTGETNNLNIGSCTSTQYSYTLTESD